MNHPVRLSVLLSDSVGSTAEQLALFALMNLGIIESLANGLVSASDAVRYFFNADNCLFVQKKLREKTAEKIMSHGVQLPDLFDALPPEEAFREFQHELSTMRSLSLKLLEEKRLIA